MKTTRITLGEVLQYDPDFEAEVDKIKDQGGVYISDKPSGDYGTVFLLNGKAVKVTTDLVELEHAQKLKGKKTNNFAFIYDVDRSIICNIRNAIVRANVSRRKCICKWRSAEGSSTF